MFSTDSHHYKVWAFPPTQLIYLQFSQLYHSRQSSGSISLVRLDNLATIELLVGVSGPDDLAGLVVDNGEGGEASVGAELAAPAGGDGVVAAVGGTTVSLGGGLGLDDVGAGLGSSGADLDAEVPGAGSIGGVASALHIADGPLRAGGHHGLAGLGRGGHDSRGGDEGGEENLSDLHYGGWLVV